MSCICQVCMVEMGHNHTFCHDLHNHTDIEVRLVWRLTMSSLSSSLSSSCMPCSSHPHQPHSLCSGLPKNTKCVKSQSAVWREINDKLSPVPSCPGPGWCRVMEHWGWLQLSLGCKRWTARLGFDIFQCLKRKSIRGQWTVDHCDQRLFSTCDSFRVKVSDISSVWVYSVKYSARWVETVFFLTLNYKYILLQH